MPAKAFISYSHVDQSHIDRLSKHLAQLERDGTLSGWFDREIHAGGNLDDEISKQLLSSSIFLACASPDYIASNYCYDRELEIALEREQAGNLTIVPVVLEPCEWLQTPLSKFKAAPKDGKPISEFTNPNVAFLDVATEIRRLCQHGSDVKEFKSASPTSEPDDPRGGSRYRVQREFDELHKRDFVERSYDEILSFFESSVGEIQSVADVEARLHKTSDAHFSCTVINRGISRGFETLHVRRGGSFGAIDILYGEGNRANTSNGGFAVVADDYQLYLNSMLFHFSGEEKKMTPREAAQMLWDDLLSKVGIGYA
ncbi:toll/interleukin-1 receptor domain-containing protein [Pseudoblastomonas halimionae]|uniref:TIR domain-containing protein n=1 Tax=Alteriqipengyuania halimionae TaxID=1926630 RepID=A0A6I4UA20_9SPHN|nr:toll/interleukin-1 receptor domain-containing protein [Alteriqipengyuania halimionae]MXP11117.1 TIR domain-containing protein [Alteriqipengyuania halimionae]